MEKVNLAILGEFRVIYLGGETVKFILISHYLPER